MPPPNVTGRLHMGHAMFVTLQVTEVHNAFCSSKSWSWAGPLPALAVAGLSLGCFAMVTLQLSGPLADSHYQCVLP